MNSFRAAVQGESLAISAELTVRRDSTAGDVRRQADALGPLVDGVQVTDNPYGWVQMSALSAAAILVEHGVDPVPILTCRDRNRLALQADIAGLIGLGIGSMILLRGPKVPKNHSVPASTVYDLSGRELLALASETGRAAAPPSGRALFIGTAARAFRPRRGWRAETLMAKVAAGAQFIQTQPCLNADLQRHYLQRFRDLGLAEDLPVVVTLSPIPSAVTARWIKKTMTDTRVPPELISRLESARDPAAEGIRACAELMQEVAGIPGVAGINLMTTGDPEAMPAAIEASGLRS